MVNEQTSTLELDGIRDGEYQKTVTIVSKSEEWMV